MSWELYNNFQGWNCQVRGKDLQTVAFVGRLALAYYFRES